MKEHEDKLTFKSFTFQKSLTNIHTLILRIPTLCYYLVEYTYHILHNEPE